MGCAQGGGGGKEPNVGASIHPALLDLSENANTIGTNITFIINLIGAVDSPMQNVAYFQSTIQGKGGGETTLSQPDAKNYASSLNQQGTQLLRTAANNARDLNISSTAADKTSNDQKRQQYINDIDKENSDLQSNISAAKQYGGLKPDFQNQELQNVNNDIQKIKQAVTTSTGAATKGKT